MPSYEPPSLDDSFRELAALLARGVIRYAKQAARESPQRSIPEPAATCLEVVSATRLSGSESLADRLRDHRETTADSSKGVNR